MKIGPTNLLRAGIVRQCRHTYKVAEGGVIVGDIKTRIVVPRIITCTVFGAVSREHGLVALCHIFLPGRSRRENDNNPTQYAENAVESMEGLLRQRGAVLDRSLGSYFLIGSADLVTAAYVIRNIFPRLELKGCRMVTDIGSKAKERKITIENGRVFLEKITVAGPQLSRLI